MTGCRLELPRGRSLVVRPVTPDDVDGLDRLYAELSLDDLHRRFFSAFRPPRSFLERWASIEALGGYGLVAVVRGEGEDRIVGEAVWSPLPDGSGEFGLTVTPAWRGWLGPYLLDQLVEEAARRGVPNLQADILVDNRKMLAVVRARGYVAVDHPDWTIVRVMIGTSDRVPSWPDEHDRPRVLVEVPGARWYAAAAAGDAGLSVIACPGPASLPEGWCPVLRGERCPLVEGADVVVCALRAGEPTTDAVREAHAARDVPVCGDLPREADEAVRAVIASMRTSSGPQVEGCTLAP